MKKVLAITLMLLLVATVAVASEVSWRVNIKADNGAGLSGASGAYLGVYGNALEEWDAQDGSVFTGIGADTPGTAMQVAAVVPGKADVYSKSIKAPTNPVPEKTWDIFVAANVNSQASVIRVLAYTQSSLTLPTPAFAGLPVKYALRMLDNKGVEGAPANGTTWEIPTPAAHASASFWACPVNLPVIVLSSKSNAALIAEGYRMQFVQAPVPEPSSLLALGTGLIGLVGLASRRRKA